MVERIFARANRSIKCPRSGDARSQLTRARTYTGWLICVFRSPVAKLKLAPFGRPRSPFLHLGWPTRYLTPVVSLALARRRSSLSLAPGCSLGSLSSPVRASNPSWTKVLPAPLSHVGRTFLLVPTTHDDVVRSSSVAIILSRSSYSVSGSASRTFPIARRNVDLTNNALTIALDDAGEFRTRVWCVVNGDVRRGSAPPVIDRVD